VKQTLRWASQNTRGAIPKEKDPKSTEGIENIVKLQAGIAALQETNTEWKQFAFCDQYAKAYRDHTTASRHSFSSSNKTTEGTYFKMGGTAITAVYRWTHHMHKYGQDSTGAGRCSWFTVLGKNNAKIIYILCCRVCTRPAIHLLGSAYFQQNLSMEQENESQLAHLDPHKQTIRYPQIIMLKYIKQVFTVNLAMGNESDSHSFRTPAAPTNITTPLSFNYGERISGSIVDMLEACDLVNIHNLQHGEAPPTYKQVSRQIDVMFISRHLVEHVEACGILPFDTIFACDHIPLYVDFNVYTLFGHPAFGTEKAALHDLHLHNTRLIDAYEEYLWQQLVNNNVEFRVTVLFQLK
jgi:hypothetical protein